MSETFYTILGIDEKSNKEEIKKRDKEKIDTISLHFQFLFFIILPSFYNKIDSYIKINEILSHFYFFTLLTWELKANLKTL